MRFFQRNTAKFVVAAAVALVGSGLFLAPRQIDLARAETCSNPPSTPAFNVYPLTFDPNDLTCKDWPLIRIRNINGSYATSSAEAQAGYNAQIGDELFATLYVHNGAAPNLPESQVTARNVRIQSTVDTQAGSKHEVRAAVFADNADSVGMSYFVNTPSNARLEVVASSGEQFDSASNLLQAGFEMGNNEIGVGDQKACFAYAMFYRFRFRVVSDNTNPTPQNTTLGITKQVRNLSKNTNFSNSVTALRGEQVEYQVKVRNTGSVAALGVFMADDLTNSGIDVIGSPQVNKSYSGTLPTGLNLGNLATGEEVTITYQANVNRDNITVTNIAIAQASNASRVEARAIVDVGTPSKGNLTIEKLVRNVTQGSGFAHSITANTGDRVEYQIRVGDNSGSVTNVTMNDQLPSSNFALISNTTRIDGSSVSDSKASNAAFGTMNSGQTHSVIFQATVTGSGSGVTTITNRACAIGDNVSQVCDNAAVTITQSAPVGQPNLQYSKSAFNETKNADATSISATREDYIRYTLTVRNTGNASAENFVITDDLSGVLPFADMVDLGGGTLNGSVISYPAVSIPAGATVTKTFRVRVKYNLPNNLTFVMVNTYGNTVRVTVVGPQVTGPITAPKTGVVEQTAAGFGGLITAAAALVSKRRKVIDFILNNK